MSARRTRAVIAALAVTLLAALAGPAGAQPSPGSARLEVDELAATVRPGGGVTIRGQVTNTGSAPLSDVQVAATLQRRTTGRVDFQEAVEGSSTRRSAVASVSADIGPLGPGAGAPVEIVRSAEELGLGAVTDRAAGVYPLRLQVLDGGEVLHELRTAAVVLPESVGEPIRTALLVPFDSEVDVAAADSVAVDPLAGGLSEDARLPAIAGALADGPDVPLTVATSGLVLEAAADAADGFQMQDAAGTVLVEPEAPQARRAASLLSDLERVLDRPTVEHVALPYASADLVALVRASQADAARRAIGDGVLSAEENTGTRPAPGVLWPPDGLNDATLEALAAGLDLVVLEPGNLEAAAPVDDELSPAAVRRLRAPGPAVTALVADPWLTPLLAAPAWPGEDGPALAAQRVLAESAALYFEAPFDAEPRGLLLAPPFRWDPTPAALRALLEGMETAPWLRPVTVRDLAAQVPAPPEPVSLAYPEAARARELPPSYLDEVGDARNTVRSLATVLAESADPVGPQRLVAIAASVDYRGRVSDGLDLLEAVNTTARTVFDGIEIVQSPPFTLTGGAGGQIPVEVRNGGPAPVEVEVGMAATRFTVDTPRQRITLQPAEVARVIFEVRTLTPGVTAPISATVTDTNGGRVLDRADVVIRARTSSVAAVVLMVGAGAVLAVWWFRDARRRQRKRNTPAVNPA